MPLPSITELGAMGGLDPLQYLQAQKQIDLGNQQGQQQLEQGAANLQGTTLQNLFNEQNNPLLVAGQQLLNQGREYTNREAAVKAKQTEDLSAEDTEAKRAKMVKEMDDDRLASLLAKGQAYSVRGAAEGNADMEAAGKKMYDASWKEQQRRQAAIDAKDKAVATAEGRIEGIRLQQQGAGARNEATNNAQLEMARIRAQKAGDQASSILKGVSEGKFGYERAASSFGILAGLEEDPEKAAKLGKLAQFFEKARASDVNRQLGKVDLQKMGLDINEFQSVLGGIGGQGSGAIPRPPANSPSGAGANGNVTPAISNDVFNQDSGSPATVPQQAAQLQSDITALQQALANPRLPSEQRQVLQQQLNATMAKTGQRPAAPTGLPPGSKQIGTSGGKPVYQTPDGKQFIGK